MARALASTARARTESSCTTRRFEFRGSWRAPASPRQRRLRYCGPLDRRVADAARLRRASSAHRSRWPLASPRRRWTPDGAMLRPTPSRSTPSWSSGGRRCMPGARRRLKFIKAPHPELYDLAARCVRNSESRRRAAGARQRLAAGARHGAAPIRRRGRPHPVDPGNRRAAAGARLCERRARHVPRGRALRDPKGRRSVSCRGSIAACPRRVSEPELAIRELTAVLEEDPGLLHGAGARGPSPTPPPDDTSSPSPTCACSIGKASSRPKTRSCSATTCRFAGRLEGAAAHAPARRARESRAFRSHCFPSPRYASRNGTTR